MATTTSVQPPVDPTAAATATTPPVPPTSCWYTCGYERYVELISNYGLFDVRGCLSIKTDGPEKEQDNVVSIVWKLFLATISLLVLAPFALLGGALSAIKNCCSCGKTAAANTGTAGANTAGANTAGANTAGANTAGANTAGANTAGANTAGANTAGANTAGANTAGANTQPALANP